MTFKVATPKIDRLFDCYKDELEYFALDYLESLSDGLEVVRRKLFTVLRKLRDTIDPLILIMPINKLYAPMLSNYARRRLKGESIEYIAELITLKEFELYRIRGGKGTGIGKVCASEIKKVLGIYNLALGTEKDEPMIKLANLYIKYTSVLREVSHQIDEKLDKLEVSMLNI